VREQRPESPRAGPRPFVQKLLQRVERRHEANGPDLVQGAAEALHAGRRRQAIENGRTGIRMHQSASQIVVQVFEEGEIADGRAGRAVERRHRRGAEPSKAGALAIDAIARPAVGHLF